MSGEVWTEVYWCEPCPSAGRPKGHWYARVGANRTPKTAVVGQAFATEEEAREWASKRAEQPFEAWP